MRKKVLLVGLGMQGKAVLYDLASNEGISHIAVVDHRTDMHDYLGSYPADKVSGCVLDAADQESLAVLMRGVDVVVEALPSSFALPLGRLAADCGVNLVSSMYYLNPGERDPARIASIREEIRKIDAAAKAKGIVILTEFGLDPGLDLMLGAKVVSELDQIETFKMYGAGIPGPNARSNPLQYKFSWSILGVMKAYRRPARIIADGQPVNIDAESVFESQHTHMLNVKEVGVPLECFANGDCVPYAEVFGIRGSVREMGRYTCRLPGHCAFWDKMVKCGFLDDTPALTGDLVVPPIQFTAALLGSQPQFQYGEGEQDMAFIRVDARGFQGGKEKRIVYQLLDMRDLATGLTAMQRTVGFTMSLGAQLILEDTITTKGILVPQDVPYDLVFPRLEKHNIRAHRAEGLLEP